MVACHTTTPFAWSSISSEQPTAADPRPRSEQPAAADPKNDGNELTVTESLLDSVSNGGDNLAVADMFRAVTRRAIVDDARGNGHYLRITWHAEIGQFVVSHWRDDVCVAAARIAPEDAAALMGVLAVGLGEAVAQLPDQPQSTAEGGVASELASLATRAQATWTNLRRKFPRSRPWRGELEATSPDDGSARAGIAGQVGEVGQVGQVGQVVSLDEQRRSGANRPADR